MDILQLLEKKNILKKDEVSRIRKEVESSSQSAEEILLMRKKVDEDLLFETKSEALGMALKRVEPREISLKILELIPEDSAKYYKMLPLSYEKGTLEVGMVFPEDVRAQEALQFLARQGNFAYHVSLITLSSFEELMKQFRNLRRETKRALQELEQEIGKEKEEPETKVQQERLVEEAPVTKMVAVILRNAVEGGASDIHIEPGKHDLRVRFRFLGELHPSLFLPLNVRQSIVARIKIISNMKIDETRKPQDGRFSTQIGGRTIDFRVATLPTPMGEKVAIRVLDPNAGAKSFEELGIEGPNLERIKKAASQPFGLILVTGPTGSGKSTTLYGILRYLNKDTVNILSLEDPVEYFLEGVNQSQVRPEIGYDFAQGLRQLLRQDPDIIMVGEVRDNETATLVIHAALTGHVVLSTLHTNTAAGVVPRLLDMGVDQYLIPATLKVAVGQRLVRKLCDNCKKSVPAPQDLQDLLNREITSLPAQEKKRIPADAVQEGHPRIFQAVGCEKCGESGFSGRIAIVEVFELTEKLSSLMSKETSEETMLEAARSEGMISMRQDGMIKVLQGITTVEEVLRVTAEE